MGSGLEGLLDCQLDEVVFEGAYDPHDAVFVRRNVLISTRISKHRQYTLLPTRMIKVSSESWLKN